MRQLFNVLRTAAVMAGQDHVITRDHLPDDFLDDARRNLRGLHPSAHPSAHPPALATADARPASAEAQPQAPAPGSAQGGAARSVVERTEAPASLEALELEAIRQAVDAAGGNISVAAKRLGVSRNTIYRKLRWSKDDSA